MIGKSRVLIPLYSAFNWFVRGGLVFLGLYLTCLPAYAQKQDTESVVVRCFVSILPQEYFVSRIGGAYANINVLVGPGQEPHTFELTPRAMASLAEADLFFGVGLPFEQVIIKKLAGLSHKVRIIDTTRGVLFLTPQEDEHHHHHGTESGDDKGPGHTDSQRVKHPPEESGQGTQDDFPSASHRDPHIWLDPELVKIQAANIAQALIDQDPAHADYYQANLKTFRRELGELDTELAESLKPYRGRRFYVYHPAFAYFAARYGLVQIPVELGGKEPTAKHIAKLIRSAKENEIKIIFVEPQSSTRSANIIAKGIGGSVIAVDALNKDYVSNMRAIGKAIREAMQPKGDASGK